MTITIETLRDALMWCTIINFATLALWGALSVLTPRVIHWPARWLRLTPEQIDVINYAGILLFKMGVILFNLVPYIALRLVG
jgi:hypothetical protein